MAEFSPTSPLILGQVAQLLRSPNQLANKRSNPFSEEILPADLREGEMRLIKGRPFRIKEFIATEVAARNGRIRGIKLAEDMKTLCGSED